MDPWTHAARTDLRIGASEAKFNVLAAFAINSNVAPHKPHRKYEKLVAWINNIVEKQSLAVET